MLIAWIVAFSLLGSLGALAGAALLLALPGPARQRVVPPLVGFATGTLLGAAFLGMLPAALAQAPARPVLAATLCGVVGFFVLEKWVLWRHCHDADCTVHGQAAPLILVGDAFHNFVDGAVIAAAFLASVPLGVTTAIAVIAHEVPQEIGDFAILLDRGYGRGRALLLNGLSAAATLPGAVLAWFWLEGARTAVPYVLAVSAASFIYIALADLVPDLHRRVPRRGAVGQVALLLLGIALIVLVRWATHR